MVTKSDCNINPAFKTIAKAKERGFEVAFCPDLTWDQVAEVLKEYEVSQGWNNVYLTGYIGMEFGYLINLNNMNKIEKDIELTEALKDAAFNYSWEELKALVNQLEQNENEAAYERRNGDAWDGGFADNH